MFLIVPFKTVTKFEGYVSFLPFYRNCREHVKVADVIEYQYRCTLT